MRNAVATIMILMLAIGASYGLLTLLRDRNRAESARTAAAVEAELIRRALPGFQATQKKDGAGRPYLVGLRREGERAIRAHAVSVTASGVTALVGIDEQGRVIGAAVTLPPAPPLAAVSLWGALGLRDEERPIREDAAAWYEAQIKALDLARPADTAAAAERLTAPGTAVTLGDAARSWCLGVPYARQSLTDALRETYGGLVKHLAAQPPAEVRP